MQLAAALLTVGFCNSLHLGLSTEAASTKDLKSNCHSRQTLIVYEFDQNVDRSLAGYAERYMDLINPVSLPNGHFFPIYYLLVEALFQSSNTVGAASELFKNSALQ